MWRQEILPRGDIQRQTKKGPKIEPWGLPFVSTEENYQLKEHFCLTDRHQRGPVDPSALSCPIDSRSVIDGIRGCVEVQ